MRPHRDFVYSLVISLVNTYFYISGRYLPINFMKWGRNWVMKNNVRTEVTLDFFQDYRLLRKIGT